MRNSSLCFWLLPSLIILTLLTACSSYQITKEAWKGTKNFWNEHVSPSAEIDYKEKGDLSMSAKILTNSMMAIDRQLVRLERVMMNADTPPTKAWVSNFMASFPWMSGFAGVKYDGSLLGQTSSSSPKELDFIPLLYEDKALGSRALRADVQNTLSGPEVMLAIPLYDSSDFLGVVVAHFDMRTLAQFANAPADIIILSPQALLWPGKYSYASTPLAGVDWKEIVSKNSSGYLKNAAGSFYYVVRYLANVPLVFAVPESGTFPEGDGNPDQGAQYFPQEIKKLSPPPREEHKAKRDIEGGRQIVPSADDGKNTSTRTGGATPHDIQPGSSESILLKNSAPEKTRIQERSLEGGDVPVERIQRPRQVRRASVQRTIPSGDGAVSPETISGSQTPQLSRPSPFGPRGADASSPTSATEGISAGTSGTSEGQSGSVNESPINSQGQSPLPGGRPSPFGPRE